MNKKILKKIIGDGLVFYILKVFYYRIHTIFSVRKWNELRKNSSNGIRLNLGSGAVKGNEFWTTVDLIGSDINWDLRHGIPLPNNSVEEIYCSHLLEHIPYSQIQKFLVEINRILKPSGKFKVAVPNARIYIDAYITKEPISEKIILYEPALVCTQSSLDCINYIAYMSGAHAYMYDEENLINTLRLGGFTLVEHRDFESGLDVIDRHAESIYAVCIK